jgi:hypothetical protein
VGGEHVQAEYGRFWTRRGRHVAEVLSRMAADVVAALRRGRRIHHLCLVAPVEHCQVSS